MVDGIIITSAPLFMIDESLGWNNYDNVSRRRAILSVLSTTISLPVLAETVGKDADCNDRSCLGVWDGLLADCPHGMTLGAGCVSSQDDTPGIFAEPWDYSENDNLEWEFQQKRLLPALEKASRQNDCTVQLVFQKDRYTRVTFSDSTGSSTGEFYFTPNDTTVQFRIASSSSTGISKMKNLQRAESIRKQLGYLKLPVLRNRKRTLLFGESDLDTFGPGSAALGPPEEMTTGELEGIDRNVDPKLKIDMLQQFPRGL
eukprot:CAMPEP_0178914986 /NCGR_PEP_ID=MMETSP0786-20121207/11754_1 /TAXON_ID=186022 /ORGANISM="Thalassionema frauenfeldii, Strain CCMP 1798" /LENGTH=257 /DNA_ID=CAMNT_0020588003 /DNA_START=112 /DNA_END=886 /DNA_ORIENTATION=-